MAAVTPIGAAIYVAQAAPLVSQHVANAQKAGIFQAALAQQIFTEQDRNKIESISEADQDHAISEKEREKKGFSQNNKEQKERKEEQKEEESSSSHILDLKA